ncbi:MAG: flagellar hook-associated protein FlgK [Lachnospiraceae bacterium]|nr:flagellar hook-associated protein FlgK [Lachnospiraceae bacterium]
MPSQFFGLTIAYSGLTAAQASQNTTANNIANINTEGYSRQELTQTASEALRTYSRYGMAGAGVDAVSIDQIRNKYLDMKYRANNTSLGEYAQKNQYMAEIENYFTDTTVVPGFNSVYVEDFYNALSKLEDDPGSTTTRQSFIGTANTVVEYFNTMAEDLSKIQDNLNQEVKDVVDKINSIAEQIASLNKQINVIENRGVTANELRDKRNNLLDELSSYVDVETREVDVYNYADPDNPTGAKVFSVSVGGAYTLVDGYEYQELECRARDEKINQSDIDGLYDIYWKSTNTKFSPVSATLSGQLKGLLELRDGNNNEFFDGTLKTAFAKEAESIEVTVPSGSKLTDLNKCTLPDSGIVTVSGFDYIYDSWSYVYDESTGEGTYTFTGLRYKDNDGVYQSGLLDGVPADATVRVGWKVDYMGIPYYQSQLNEWVRNFAATFNKIEGRGYDLNGDYMGEKCFFQMVDSEGTQHDMTQLDDSRIEDGTYAIGTGVLGNGTYTYNQLTAKNFIINAEILEDPTKMATTYDKEASTSVDSADLVKDLSSIKTDKSKMSFRGCSSAEFLQSLLSDIALNKQSANTFETNFTTIGQTLDNQRLSVSGVDTDEEALNLVKFQHAYELSAKVMQTMTEMYDRLILNTGV